MHETAQGPPPHPAPAVISFFAGLRGRLLLLVLLSLLPSLGLICYSGYEQAHLAVTKARQDIDNHLQRIAWEQGNMIDEGQKLLLLLAHLPAIRQPDMPACTAIFRKLLQQDQRYAFLALIGTEGKIICSNHSCSPTVDVTDRDYYRRALASKKFTVGEYITGRVSHKYALPLAYPVLSNSGRVEGVLLASLDLAWLNHRVKSMILPMEAILTVFDHNGNILARVADSEKYVGKTLPATELVKTILASGQGSKIMPGLDGITRLYVFAPLSEKYAGGYISLGIPMSRVQAQAHQVLVRNLITLGVLGFFTLIAAWLFGHLFILRTTTKLVKATRGIAEGDYRVRTGLTYGNSECGQLAQAFDQMAATLQQREAENVRARGELAQSEGKFRGIFENISQGIALISPAMKVMEINPQMKAWFPNIDLSPQPFCYQAFHDPPRQDVCPFCPTFQALQDGQVHEYIATDPDGQRRKITASPLRDMNNKVIAAIEVVEDITEEVRLEEELRESEAKYRLLVNQIPAVVFQGYPDWSVDFFDNKIKEITGYSKADFDSRRLNWANLIPAEDMKNVKQVFIRALKTDKSYVREHRILRPDGNIRWVQSRGRIFTDAAGRISHTSGVIFDVTEIKQAENNIQRQNTVLAGINKIFREALNCRSEKELGQVCLQVAERLTGSRFGFVAELNESGRLNTLALSDPGLEACKLPRVEGLALVQDQEVHGIYGEVIRTGQSLVTNNPAAHPHSVGIPEWHPPITAFLGVPLKQGDKIIGMIALGNKDGGYTETDLEDTETLSLAIAEALQRHRAEKAVWRLNVELEQRVQERTAQLEAANKELEAFSYSVSHDLRAPLRSINGFSQALLEDYARLLDDQGRGFLVRVIAATERMSILIDEMLELSRLIRLEVDSREVDLSALARTIALDLHESEPGRQVKFVIQNGLRAQGDATVLRAVLENLLGNAWKYTSKHPKARIEFGRRTNGDGVPVYFVKDDGAGFDMAYADKLFGAFQRLHSPSEFPGNGVGLATVQRIVRRHGGRVWAEGAVGQGATFSFTLASEEGKYEHQGCLQNHIAGGRQS